MRSRLLRIPRYSDILARKRQVLAAGAAERAASAVGTVAQSACRSHPLPRTSAKRTWGTSCGRDCAGNLHRAAPQETATACSCHATMPGAMLCSPRPVVDMTYRYPRVSPQVAVPVRPKMPEQSCGIRFAATRMAMRQQVAFLFPFSPARVKVNMLRKKTLKKKLS